SVASGSGEIRRSGNHGPERNEGRVLECDYRTGRLRKVASCGRYRASPFRSAPRSRTHPNRTYTRENRAQSDLIKSGKRISADGGTVPKIIVFIRRRHPLVA